MMENLLANCVQKNLNHFMFTNAIFLCELLLAQFPSEVSRFRFFYIQLHFDFQILASSLSITSFLRCGVTFFVFSVFVALVV